MANTYRERRAEPALRKGRGTEQGGRPHGLMRAELSDHTNQLYKWEVSASSVPLFPCLQIVDYDGTQPYRILEIKRITSNRAQNDKIPNAYEPYCLC